MCLHKDKQILDSVRVANECIKKYKWEKKKGWVVKLDLLKRTEWDFEIHHG